jgi:hypothetical protein
MLCCCSRHLCDVARYIILILSEKWHREHNVFIDVASSDILFSSFFLMLHECSHSYVCHFDYIFIVANDNFQCCGSFFHVATDRPIKIFLIKHPTLEGLILIIA